MNNSIIEITCPSDSYKKFNFPAGELHIVLPISWYEKKFHLKFNFNGSNSIFELLLLSHTLKINKNTIKTLSFPYLPFGQADRVNEFGECFSLRLFCDLINNVVKPQEVVVLDPHSDVCVALLNNCIIVPQHDLLKGIVANIVKENNIKSFYFITPDAGASKKIHKLNEFFRMPVVMCEKVRSTKDGSITGTKVYHKNFRGKPTIIIDDVVVNGKTYIEIAKIIKKRNCGKIYLVSTHGIYGKGLEVFDGYIDEIYNFHKGKVVTCLKGTK